VSDVPRLAANVRVSSVPRWLRPPLALTLCTLLLIWPALYNRQPIFFPDTSTYVRGADAGLQAAFHLHSEWGLASGETVHTDRLHGSSEARAAERLPTSSLSSISDKTVLRGRSPYYGTLLYLGAMTGGFWLSVVIQALSLLAALALTLRALELYSLQRLTLTVLALAALTSAPFFASFLMPDAFTAIAILGASVLIALPRPLRVRELVGWGLLLSAAAVFHDTHVLILAMLLGIGLIGAVLSRSLRNWRGLVLIGAVLIVAALAQELFTLAVEHVVGAPPLRPPFLMARMIADGPGYRYLKRSCPQNGLVVCRYLDRLPATSDEFLWSAGPHAVFAAVPPEERRALEREQLRFAWAVLRTDPWGTLSAQMRNVLVQLRDFGLVDFNYSELTRVGLALKLPEHPWQRLQQTAAYHEEMPTRWFASLEVLASAVALAFAAWVLLPRRRRSQVSPIVVRTTLLIISGVVFNCILCATVSGPYPRFLERAVWLIAFAALLLLFAMRDARVFRINKLVGNAHAVAHAEGADAQTTESRV
jgi:hypothetical protein